MKQLDRRTFLDRLTLASLAYLPLIRTLDRLNIMPQTGDIKQTRSAIPALSAGNPVAQIFDMHCHPNLKNYLWGKKMWRHHPSKKGDNIANMQVDINKLLKGNVKGFLAAHYLPERGMREQARTLRKIFPALKSLAPVFASKIENGTDANFRQLLTMLDEFEEHLELTNQKAAQNNGKDIIKIARSYTEFETNANNGVISAIHSIEGSHSLGRNMKPEAYIANLERLYERGVCAITLAHFFQNDLCYPVEGIPPAMKKNLGISWRYHEEFDDKPLTPIGLAVVTRMLELGMIVDLTHLAPIARAQIFAINAANKSPRPLIFSHAGVRDLFTGPSAFDSYKYMGAKNTEIDQIKQCRGVIGVIFMNYWLVGCDTHTKGCPDNFSKGIDYVVNTIKFIRERTGSYENIAIGSDFDGFADSPADLKDAGYFGALVDAIKISLGTTQAELDMITHGNAMRVLKEGWGKI